MFSLNLLSMYYYICKSNYQPTTYNIIIILDNAAVVPFIVKYEMSYYIYTLVV